MQLALKNTLTEKIHFILEPEAQEFAIPSGESVALVLHGSDPVGQLTIGRAPDGQLCISLWPDHGDYEVLVHGKDAWELLHQKHYSVDIFPDAKQTT
jgi:hypothetical protein